MLHSAFFGSSSYVLPLLSALQTHTDLRLIVTRADKPAGREKKLLPSPPKEFGQKHEMDVLTPDNLTTYQELIMNQLKEKSVDVAIVADYGQLISKNIFATPKFQTINIHFSRLPDLRGASPVQWTILRGDKTAWITFFLIVEELDAGPILYQHQVPIRGQETTQELYSQLFEVAADLLPNILHQYTNGKLEPKPQDYTKATFTRRLTREDGFVDVTILKNALEGKPSHELQNRFFPASSFELPASIFIDRMLRAFTPWPGIWTEIKVQSSLGLKPPGQAKFPTAPFIPSRVEGLGAGKVQRLRLKILKAHLDSARTTPAGMKLVPDIVQLEGKKPVEWEEFKVRFSYSR